jgi:hypothetical protein
MDLAVSTPTSNEPINPGPTVTAIASISSWGFFRTLRASWITGIINFTCYLAAISGIIPPVAACSESEVATTLDSSVTCFAFLSALIIAAAVSSQLVSIPRIYPAPLFI